MNRLLRIVLVVSVALVPAMAVAQTTNPLWHEAKVRNYLPHMTSPEVKDLLTRTDMVIIPIASIEQHANHLPIGTDFINGVERAKLVAQRTDVLVAPILLPGSSPYHMEFAGTITLPAETIQRVYFEACQSLLAHGFRRFLLLNSHGGNAAITRYLVDRINQETAGIAVDLGEAASPFMAGGGSAREPGTTRPAGTPVFDRHGGVGETADGLYLFPSLVDLSKAQVATLTMPEHLQKMVPDVLAGDRTATLVFLAEGLKAKQTGKGTSAAEMSTTGQWGLRDPREATVEQGRRSTERFVDAAVQFIERWKALRPMARAGASGAAPATNAPGASSSSGPVQSAGDGRGARQVVRPEKFPATGLPYSPGILVDGTLYVSGQLGRDPATAKLVPGGIEAETRQAITNVREVLKAAGMDLADVVSVTAFITSFDDFPAFNKVYREHFATDPPARATVQVAGLNLGAKIEIQMIAARPGGR